MPANISRDGFTCSACGWSDFGGLKYGHLFGGWQPNYCPNCGKRIIEHRVPVWERYPYVWQDFDAQETKVSRDGVHWKTIGGDAE